MYQNWCFNPNPMIKPPGTYTNSSSYCSLVFELLSFSYQPLKLPSTLFFLSTSKTTINPLLPCSFMYTSPVTILIKQSINLYCFHQHTATVDSGLSLNVSLPLSPPLSLSLSLSLPFALSFPSHCSN